jgi:ketosteroid isomerase-like protein
MAQQKLPLGTANETEAAFYDALSRADINALMAVWADDEDIVCIHPGAPRLVGHASIRASWESILDRGGVHISPLRLHATQNLMTAVHNIVEDIRNVEADRQDMQIIATNVYMKTPLGWRMVAHHASVAPGKALSHKSIAAMLH